MMYVGMAAKVSKVTFSRKSTLAISKFDTTLKIRQNLKMHVNTIRRADCQCAIHPLSNDVKIAGLSCIFAPKIAILPGWAKNSFADK